MNNIKCNECGLVNWADQTECKRCGSLLTVQHLRAKQLIAMTPEPRPLFSKGLKFLTGLLALTLVTALVSRILGIGDSDFAVMAAILFMFSGMLLLLVGQVWTIVRIFE